MHRLLIVEDDPAIQKALQASFEQEEYEVLTASEGIDGYEKAQDSSIDCIILDLMLPGKNGKDICKDLRNDGIKTPILILTSKHEELDKVLLFELGADDYVTKPPGLRELRARVNALIRRTSEATKEIEKYSFDNIKIDFKKQEALKNNKPIKLSSKEFEILQYLIQHSGEVISRSTLLNEIWGYDVYPTTRTVDNFILNIRKKIEDDPAHPKHLITVYTSGYKFIN
jgi:two-component system, OmpR family, alkaline phosphatase synthesis response regulator PhoP